MKLRLYFMPSIVVLLLAGAMALLWLLTWGLSLWLAPLAALYSVLFAAASWAWWRSYRLERWMDWPGPARLLILAPHEDDCVIAAGGLGALNKRLGGAVRIAYLAPDEAPGMAEIRAKEAEAAWSEAGIAPNELLHLNLLPPLLDRNPEQLRAAARAIRSIIDDFKPTTIVVPMFEGGHIHHDMVAAMLDSIVTEADTFTVFEAPEYGPYVSLSSTPHRIVTLCARWLAGLVSYYGPADGIDGRHVFKIRLHDGDLACKQRMLAAFKSQNAPSLVATRAYPDRLVRWQPGRPRRLPFDADSAYLRLARFVDRLLPRRLASQLVPGQRDTIGRPGGLTDWRKEWGD